ncbi:MAG: circularly permuted type 2 ATP-grasp protein [bacterium]|nr:circularly permuted type 2 ATP-grasp protein [bacterium]
MKIAKEVYEAHRDLSGCSAAFLDFVKENPACLEQDSFKEVVSTYFGYVKFHPWPTFINEKTWEMLETASVKVYQLISTIPERLFALDRDKIVQYYQFPESAVKLMLHKGARKCPRDLLSRGDFIYSPANGLKCLEFNMVSNIGGGWQADALEPHYFNSPVLARFIKEYGAHITRTGFASSLLAHVVEKAMAHEPFAGEDEINTAVVFPKIDGSAGDLGALVGRLKELYRHILRQKNGGLKGELVITDFFRLKMMKDRVVYGSGGDTKKIHVMVEKSNGLVPQALLDVVESGNLLLFNGPIGSIMSSKLNLALLSENENSDLFSPEERETIKNHVPWTRKVTAGLEDYILSHRERLVLKPGDGIGGYGVSPGRNTSPGQWKQQVEKALEERNWVVQEYIPSFTYLYQDGERGAVEHHMVWGIFVFGSRGRGGFTRVLPAKHHKGVINASQGARLNVILEVEEARGRSE